MAEFSFLSYQYFFVLSSAGDSLHQERTWDMEKILKVIRH